MPVLDGCEASKQIRSFLFSKQIDQPLIIAVTGHIEDSYIEKAYKAGMNQVSPKPIENNFLEEIL